MNRFLQQEDDCSDKFSVRRTDIHVALNPKKSGHFYANENTNSSKKDINIFQIEFIIEYKENRNHHNDKKLFFILDKEKKLISRF